MRRWIPLTALAVALVAPRPAAAEGSLGPELDSSQALRATTDIYVDVLDFRTETFVWTGKGNVIVRDPTDTIVGPLASGATFTPTMNGAYRLDLQEDQYDVNTAGDIIRSTIVEWDVTLFVSGAPRVGRVFSYEWGFNTGSFAEDASTNASFYARVPGGDSESFAVMELRTDGLAGFIYEIQGNSTGVRGPNAGRSVPESGAFAENEYEIYLNPPDAASYTFLAPTVADFTFRGGLEVDGGVAECDEFVAGSTRGEFSFTSNVEGTFHLVCDLNEDGLFDIVDDGDFLILGEATMGTNTVDFDGLDNNGNPFPVGEHECRVRVTVGEFHYVGRDIETSFRGLRMFQVRRDGSRTPLSMYWNDALVQSRATTMPSPYAFIAASTSGPAGLSSGDPTAEPIPLGETVVLDGANSRAWGDFVAVGGSGTGKGNEAYLDTYTWLDEALSTPITISSVNGNLDTDGEGLTDYVERCITGTDPNDADSDDDSLTDDVETGDGMPGVDTDADGLIDALDPDDDNDCVPTILEDPDGDGNVLNDNTDMDALANYVDPDDDGDGIRACDEDPDGDGDPTNDDADGDGIPNYLEIDSDDDCTLRDTVTGIMCEDDEDACPLEPEDGNGYMDLDGCPEPDEDEDGVPDDLDNCVSVANPMQEDFDGDGEGDACDRDIDDDGLLNECETTAATCPLDCRAICPEELTMCTGCAATDPYDPDSDAGGVQDGEEIGRGTDPTLAIDDPLPGAVTGGGVFHCSASREDRGPPWALLAALGLALVIRRRR